MITIDLYDNLRDLAIDPEDIIILKARASGVAMDAISKRAHNDS